MMFQGSVLKIDQPSHITVTSTGVKVDLLGAHKLDARTEENLERADPFLPAEVGRMGRQPNPNSLRMRVYHFVSALKAKGVDRWEITRQAKEAFQNENASSVNTYISEGLRK
jgi:hypothetical protein